MGERAFEVAGPRT